MIRMLLKIVIVILSFLLVSYGMTIESTSSYTWDTVPVSIFKSDLKISQKVTDRLIIDGELKYFNFEQPEISGIRHLNTTFMSIRLGGFFINSKSTLFSSLHCGLNLFVPRKISSEIDAEIKYTIPFTSSLIFKYIQFSSSGWYTERILNAAALKNYIKSSGYSLGLSAAVAKRNEIGTNFRQEYLLPSGPILDSSLFIDRPYWDNIENDITRKITTNRINTFSAYWIVKVCDRLFTGYCFVWADAKDDRMTMTYDSAVTRYVMPPRIMHFYKYANYPYTTPNNEISHNLILTAPLSIKHLSVSIKTVFPLYSSKSVVVYPDTIDAAPHLNYSKFKSEYKQKNTAPFTFELKLAYPFSPRFSILTGYDYFSFPYISWGYLSYQKYCLHSIHLKMISAF